MNRDRYLSPETIAEFRGHDIYHHLVKKRIHDYEHLREFLQERFPALALYVPLSDDAADKIARAIRLETGLERALIDSVLSEHILSDENAKACIAAGAMYHDVDSGDPVELVTNAHKREIAKSIAKGGI